MLRRSFHVSWSSSSIVFMYGVKLVVVDNVPRRRSTSLPICLIVTVPRRGCISLSPHPVVVVAVPLPLSSTSSLHLNVIPSQVAADSGKDGNPSTSSYLNLEYLDSCYAGLTWTSLGPVNSGNTTPLVTDSFRLNLGHESGWLP